MHTLQDLESAKAVLVSLQDRWENYSGNNPDKFKTDIRLASEKVDSIHEYLKLSGVIALTPQEELWKALDQQFPNARSKEIVTFQGCGYQRKFTPGGKSLSGKTVTKLDCIMG